MRVIGGKFVEVEAGHK